MNSSLVALLLFVISSSGSSSELSILAMGPFNGAVRSPDWAGGPALIPAARQAVDDINNRSDILQGFRLRLLESESGCNFEDKTIVSFVNSTFHNFLGLPVVGMVGPGCSKSAIALNEIIRQPKLNLMQVSIASSPVLNGTEFENSFRIVGSSLVYVNGYSKLIEVAGWEQVGIIYDNKRQFHTSTYVAFEEKVTDDVLRFTHAINGDHVSKNLMEEIQEACIRVIFIFAGIGKTAEVLCLAYKTDIFYPDVQFLIVERVREDFTKDVHLSAINKTCSKDEMQRALNGAIFISSRRFRENKNSTKTAARKSFNQFNATYYSYFLDYLEEKGIKLEDIPKSAPIYTPSYYDAVWALALALNVTISERNISKINHSKDIADDMRENLLSLNFEGMTGLITFDPNLRDVHTIGSILTQCFAEDDRCVSGTFVNNTLDFAGVRTIQYYYDNRTYGVPLALGITIIFLLLVIAVALLMLQVAFCKMANVKEIKATSPHLNHLIFSGCYMFILLLLALTVRETFTGYLDNQHVIYGVLCSSVYWTFALGFTLIFGTVTSKTWRIYKIFSHFKKGQVRFVSNELLILFVVVLIVVDVCLLTVWNVTDPWHISVRLIEKRNSVRINQLRCECGHLVHWLSALFLFKGILAILLVILSIFVRRIKRKSFKSTKQIIVLIYILILDFFVGFTIYGVFMNSVPILSFLGLTLCFVAAVVFISSSLFLVTIWPVVVQRFMPKQSREEVEPSLSSNHSFRRKVQIVQQSPTPSRITIQSTRNDLNLFSRKKAIL